MNLIAIALVAFFQFGRATSCDETCEGIRKEILAATERECKAAKSTSVLFFNACQHGMKAAFANCPSLCGGKGTIMVSTSKACKGTTSSEQWCRKGFASTMSRLKAYNFPESKPDMESNDEVATVETDEGKDEIESGMLPSIKSEEEKDETFNVDFSSEAKDGQSEEVKEIDKLHSPVFVKKEQTNEISDMLDDPLLSEAESIDTNIENDAS